MALRYRRRAWGRRRCEGGVAALDALSRTAEEEPRALRLLAPVLLFALALGVRSLSWRSVLLEDRVQLFGADSFYHLRRIAYTVRRFPEILEFDRYINFPHGAKPIWTPVFDWLAALAVLPFAGEGRVREVERAAVWIPPLLGAATVVALYLLARRTCGWRLALLAGVLLSVWSGHFWYSQLGYVDHHAAVALASTGVLASAMSLLEPSARAPGRWRASLATGAALAAALAVWPGALLYVAIAEGALIVQLLALHERAAATRFAARVAAVQALAFALLLPAGATSAWPQWGAFTPVVLSRFQPWLFGALALWALACAGLWSRTPAGAGRVGRLASGVLLGLAVLAASLAAFPELADGPGDAWRWLGRRESFQASVAESQPLLLGRGRLGSGAASERLSYFLYLSPLALAALVVHARRTRRAPLLLLAGWTAALLLATLLQRRFFNSLSVSLAWLAAWSVFAVYAALPAAARATRARRLAAVAALAAGLLLLVAPMARSYRTHLANLRVEPGAEPISVTDQFARRRVAIDLALWLRRTTPRTAGWLDPDGRPEYGVMAAWGIGHVIEHVGRRPTVIDNFGDDLGGQNFRLARQYFASPEAQAAEVLDRLRVRYVIAQRRRGFLGPRPGEDSMHHALFFLDGVGAPAGAPDAKAVDGLSRHRLLYESRPLRRGGDESLFKLFEYVPGATLRGRAAPGQGVQASLPLTTNRGRELVYRARAEADADGRYTLRVPYATGGRSGAVRTASHYKLACAGERAPVRVDEEAVARGLVVAAPALCADASGPVR